MINNIKYKILLVLLVLVSSSCNKWLELEPQDGIIRDKYWQTKEQLQSSVIGCYAALIIPGLTENLFMQGELRADMITTSNTALIDEVNVTTADIQSNNYLAHWGQLYFVISLCNSIIEYGPGVANVDKTLSPTELNGYLGEARGLRALMYFYLLRIWGEVPLQLEATSTDSRIKQLEKSSKEKVYAQILADLDFAAQYTPLDYGNRADYNKGRLTRYGVYAIQADAYLWMDRYDDCIAACNKVINSNRFGLIDGANPSLWFLNVFYNGNSNEGIFELQFDNLRLNNFFFMFGATNRRFNAAARVVDEMYGVDPLVPENKDIRADGGFVRASDYTIWKYIGTTSIDRIRAQADSYSHWFFYCYADILLLKAEALAWTGKGSEALELVKLIRDRARAVGASSLSPDPNSPNEVSDYILK